MAIQVDWVFVQFWHPVLRSCCSEECSSPRQIFRLLCRAFALLLVMRSAILGCEPVTDEQTNEQIQHYIRHLLVGEPSAVRVILLAL
jgi:hypothetical protein